MADHRLRLASSHMLSLASALAAAVTKDAPFQKLAAGLDVKPEWIAECAADLAGQPRRMSGGRRAPICRWKSTRSFTR